MTIDHRNLQAKTVGLLELGELLKYLEVAAHKMSKMTRPVVLKPRIKQVRFTEECMFGIIQNEP